MSGTGDGEHVAHISSDVASFYKPGTPPDDGVQGTAIQPLLRDGLVILSGGRDKRGGAILTFPAHTNIEKTKYEDLKTLVTYLSSVSSDDVRELGFSVVIDMRGSTWHTVKPILNVLQECIPQLIHAAYIIKPEKFWEKQKTSLGSTKFKFETSLVSVDGLSKIISVSQLTGDLGGTLYYDNDEWIEIRLLLEEFTWKAVDLLRKLNQLQELLTTPVLPDDLNGAKLMIEDHSTLRQKVTQAPVEMLEAEAHSILEHIPGTSYTRNSGDVSGAVGSHNADFQKAATQMLQLLENLCASRQHLQQLWHSRKVKLEQCFQQRLFEKDVEKMSEWISHNRELFLVNYTQIGNSHEMASELQTEHNVFSQRSMNVFVNVTRIMSVAQQLCDAGHYAAPSIHLQAGKLDKDWRTFRVALEDRSTVLALSVIFHKKLNSIWQKSRAGKPSVKIWLCQK